MLLKGNKPLLFVSGASSFFIYFGIVIILFYKFLFTDNEATKFSKQKESVFEISMLEIQKVEEKKPDKIPEIKEKVIEKNSDESASRTPIAGISVNNLFAQINIPKPIEKKVEDIQSKDDELAKKKQSIREKQKDEPKLEKLDIEKSASFKENIAINVSEGEFDEYYSKIHEILSARWNPEDRFIGLESTVSVTIDNLGKFQYKIISRSGNREYDEMLILYLDGMNFEKFPPYEKGEKTVIEVIFKTKGDR